MADSASEKRFDIRNYPLLTIPVDDITIACRVIGEGEPLLLIMGYASSMEMWDQEFIHLLSQSYKVILFDNRGMGYSGSSDKEFSIPLFARDTEVLMDALGIESAHILGYSMGTYVAFELAFSSPSRVKSLSLVNGDCGRPSGLPITNVALNVLNDTSGTVIERAIRLIHLILPEEWHTSHPEPFGFLPEVYEPYQEANVIRQMEAIQSWKGVSSRLSEITVPTLVLSGMDDAVIPPENAYIMGQRIPGSWIIPIRGGGHGIFYQYPESLARIIETFLEIS